MYQHVPSQDWGVVHNQQLDYMHACMKAAIHELMVVNSYRSLL